MITLSAISIALILWGLLGWEVITRLNPWEWLPKAGKWWEVMVVICGGPVMWCLGLVDVWANRHDDDEV